MKNTRARSQKWLCENGFVTRVAIQYPCWFTTRIQHEFHKKNIVSGQIENGACFVVFGSPCLALHRVLYFRSTPWHNICMNLERLRNFLNPSKLKRSLHFGIYICVLLPSSAPSKKSKREEKKRQKSAQNRAKQGRKFTKTVHFSSSEIYKNCTFFIFRDTL